ncbi:hypothetical protein [uncultured Jatrophihabitans sp.]|uniref:hypothetical protein n=1 Tax=uncultured Jatrophihabitans sp. TaxID=1610747 RepID=UPI0035C95437
MPGPGEPRASRTVAAWNATRAWRRRATLPLLTVGVFLAIAMILWANAAANRYRFNLAIAVLGSVPLAILLIRGVKKAQHAERGAQPHH